MASCAQCNAELDDGAKFCIKCGTAVSTEVACPSCSTVNEAGAKFCTNCGQVLGGAVAPTVAGQSGDDVYARRVSADEIEASTFRSSLVIRPGSYGVELQNGVVTRTFKEPGKQTIEGFFSRLRDVFSSDSKKEVMVVDVREVVFSLSTNVPNHTLLVFLVAGGRPPETDALSLFVERVVKDKRQLSTIDVERVAKKYLTENFPASTIGDGKSLEVLGRMEEGLRTQFGLVATEIRLERGVPRNSYDLTLGGNEGSEQFCEHCDATILPGVKFCTKCGTEQSASRLTALASKDGTPVVVDVSVVLEVDESGLKDEDLPLESSLQNPVESILRRLLREHDYDALDQGQLSKVSAQLQTALSSQLDVSKFGRVTSATVLDIKTVEEDWKLGTRAAVTQAQEELEASRTMTGIERDKVDVQEMALRIGLQRTKMELDVELQEYFDRDQAALEDRARRQSMVGQHADLDVADAQRAAERDIATDEADRKRDRTVTARDREDKAGDRGEEIKDLGHEMDLETRTARHDVDLGAIAGEADSAQKRREADDAIYAEKQAQDLKLEKMGGML
ncbi:MAG: zinc-ribbon domain-containing protein, partial [Planctomycetota bacterium]|nr:zinc-ribbon domain-containing protein [Planctomycetota bacterium]